MKGDFKENPPHPARLGTVGRQVKGRGTGTVVSSHRTICMDESQQHLWAYRRTWASQAYTDAHKKTKRIQWLVCKPGDSQEETSAGTKAELMTGLAVDSRSPGTLRNVQGISVLITGCCRRHTVTFPHETSTWYLMPSKKANGDDSWWLCWIVGSDVH